MFDNKVKKKNQFSLQVTLSESQLSKVNKCVLLYLYPGINTVVLFPRSIYRGHYIMGEDVTARGKQEGVQLAEQTTR